MHKSVFTKGILFALGLAGLATAQPYTSFQYWDPKDPAKAPALLSKTGFYTNMAVNKNIISSATLFEVNTPLWSDAAAKKRWFILKPGKSITFKEMNDYWDYPDSTVFVKNFAIDTVAGDSTTRVMWETRFLILKKEVLDPAKPNVKVDNWYGFSYKWRKDQKEADLVPDTGLKATIKWYPKGRNQPAVLKKWIFPDRQKCMECHRTENADTLHGRSVLGFFTAQLNMPSPTNPGVNQLEDFFAKGKLKGTKPANWNSSPRWYGLKSTDPLATPERKARSYIAANCSGCHGDRGMDLGATFGVDLNYDYFTGVPHMKFEYKEVSWPYGLDKPELGEPSDHPTKGVYLVTPGYPEKSVILFRQKSRRTDAADDPDPNIRAGAFDPDRNQMPPLATFEVDEEAMKVISEWIKGIPPRQVSIRNFARQALNSPAIQGRSLVLPPSLAKGNPRVSLLGISGRTETLSRTGNGTYAIPGHLPAGIYVVRVGAQTFTRYLF